MESYSVSDNGIDLEKDLEQKIGNRVKALRLLQKRTIQDLANGADLSKSMISKIENNKTIPSIAALVKIASSLGVSVSDILEAEKYYLQSSFLPAKSKKVLHELIKATASFLLPRSITTKRCSRS